MSVDWTYFDLREMPQAHHHPAESSSIPGHSPVWGRPLFVPAGLRSVRTGPTTHFELERLLEDAPDAADPSEVSGVRSRPVARPRLWLRLLMALGIAQRRAS